MILNFWSSHFYQVLGLYACTTMTVYIRNSFQVYPETNCCSLLFFIFHVSSACVFLFLPAHLISPLIPPHSPLSSLSGQLLVTVTLHPPCCSPQCHFPFWELTPCIYQPPGLHHWAGSSGITNRSPTSATLNISPLLSQQVSIQKLGIFHFFFSYLLVASSPSEHIPNLILSSTFYQ